MPLLLKGAEKLHDPVLEQIQFKRCRLYTKSSIPPQTLKRQTGFHAYRNRGTQSHKQKI